MVTLVLGAAILLFYWTALVGLARTPGAGPLTVLLLPVEGLLMIVVIVATSLRSRNTWSTLTTAALAAWAFDVVNFTFVLYLTSTGALF
jgi:hypothetical protein